MAINTKDKYYTPQWLVKYQIKKTLEIIGRDNITDVIEPSAGDGAYIKELDKEFDDVSYYDLYPEHEKIKKQDFLKLRTSYKKGRLMIGNPPFGIGSHLWKGFCRKSSEMADYVSFIGPSSQYKTNYYFRQGVLIYSELLDGVEYIGSEKENGTNTKVNTCLNIYRVDDKVSVDWREEKIKQQVKFGRVFHNDDKHYDHYLFNATNGPDWGSVIKRDDYVIKFGVTILDKTIEDKMMVFLNNFHKYRDEVKCLTAGPPFISNGFFYEKLKIFLYPTRDEMIEKDLEIKNIYLKDKPAGDYYIRFGKLHKHLNPNQHDKAVEITILNDDMRDKVDELMLKIDDIIPTYPGVVVRSGGLITVYSKKIKDIIKEYLYSEDFYYEGPPQSENVIRKIYSKELF